MDSGKRIHTHRVVKTPTLRAKVWTQSNQSSRVCQVTTEMQIKTEQNDQRPSKIRRSWNLLSGTRMLFLWESFQVVQWFSHLHWHVTFQFSQILHHLTFFPDHIQVSVIYLSPVLLDPLMFRSPAHARFCSAAGAIPCILAWNKNPKGFPALKRENDTELEGLTWWSIKIYTRIHMVLSSVDSTQLLGKLETPLSGTCHSVTRPTNRVSLIRRLTVKIIKSGQSNESNATILCRKSKGKRQERV